MTLGPFRTAAVALPALLGSCSGEEAAAGPRPVILISIDSLRADHTTPYGRVPEFAPGERTTPFLQRLADEGVLFENASASAPWTLPSHMSLLTGMHPVEHGVRVRKFSPAAEIDLLSNRFKAAGYATGGFFTGPFLHPVWGFGRGFDVYAPAADYLGTVAAAEHLAASGKGPEVEAMHARSHTDAETAEQLVTRALQWLEEDRRHERPFFLFLHFWDPHYDYFPPADYRARFLPEDDGSIRGDELMQLERELSAQDLKRLRALYDAEIRYTDDWIARFFEQLEEWGVEDPIVAVVSDHGDEFLEHGNRGHHLTLYEEVIRVPMVIRAPGLIEPGQRVSGTVALYDVAPTLMDLAGLDPAAWSERSGRNLRPLWEEEDRDLPVGMDLLRPTRKIELNGYRHGATKGIYDAYAVDRGKRGVFSVYDLAADPGEQAARVLPLRGDAPVARSALEFLLSFAEKQHQPSDVAVTAEMSNLLDDLGYADE